MNEKFNKHCSNARLLTELFLGVKVVREDLILFLLRDKDLQIVRVSLPLLMDVKAKLVNLVNYIRLFYGGTWMD